MRPAARPELAELERLLPQCMLRDRVRLERQVRSLRSGRTAPDPGRLARLERQAADSAGLRQRRERGMPALRYPDELPITACRDRIVQSLRRHPVLVVAGQTGSGKTTQLPKMLLEAGLGRQASIAVTQPRRVAALSLSRRLAEELGVSWGREVGCRIRFRDQTAPETCVKMVTDGMLLAEIQSDPLLLEYDAVVIDEAHERSLNIDFLLGYLRLVRQRRPELRVVVTSATIDTEAFSRAFAGAPVIEVSGRVYPVEVRYWPLDELLEDSSDYTYIEAAVQAVEQLGAESDAGDVLVFMPSERDIRETRDLLEGRLGDRFEVVPLFSRLTAAEQQRVFAPGPRRRVVVATNIAETSLTIPRIRYVVDPGLARINRYNPRTQTQRLPIEPISQSSAEQRRGRCGRVEAGVCVRLYSEADLLSRPRHTAPEIQRANLAEVILRMFDLHLGQVEAFPFLDPPQPAAIRGGYLLLEELGALDAEHRLTRLGSRMARLPIAPTMARMVLQAQEEGCLQAALVIAAGISVQDPRERPLAQQEVADRMHRRFVHPESDFLTLLNIWNAYHDQLEEQQTQGRMRRFCKEHFLSFVRMREWRDIHAQLEEVLREQAGFRFEAGGAEYDAVHRAVLSGLLSNVAHRKEHNLYQAARGREVMLFPGSGLFQKKPERPRRPAVEAEAEGTEGPGRTPAWIMAAEMVETSRLFGRTVARIRSAWLLDLGRHLCRASYQDPHWSERAGRVLVRETLTLYGLEVTTRQVAYERVDPVEATRLFIRAALVEDGLRSPHAFLEHNRRLCDRLRTWQIRVRGAAGLDLDQEAFDFYARRLVQVSSVHDLNRLVEQGQRQNPRFLFMGEVDLLGDRAAAYDDQAFPAALEVEGQSLALSYAYRPGQEEDGVTLRLPYQLLHAVSPEVLEWIVPGLMEEKIACLLRSLPKAVRKRFVPVPEKARRLAAELRPGRVPFLESLEACIRQLYHIQIRRPDWDLSQLPDHLRMRVEVIGTEGQAVAAGRDLEAVTAGLDRSEPPADLEAWKRAEERWSREGIREWDFEDLPEQVEVGAVSGVPLWGYPGLEAGASSARLRLFRRRAESREATREGALFLARLELRSELTWLRRDLGELAELKLLCRPLGTVAELQQDAQAHLERYLFDLDAPPPMDRRTFAGRVKQARSRLPGLAPRFIEQVHGILALGQEVRLCPHPYPDLDQDLARLLPPRFLRATRYQRLTHLARYLKALLVRCERARLGPGKDAQKAALVGHYQEAWERARAEPPPPDDPRAALVEEYGWMVEEFRVSVFAQELGTDGPVSAKRLDRKLEALA